MKSNLLPRTMPPKRALAAACGTQRADRPSSRSVPGHRAMACRFLVAAFVFAVVALSPSSFAAQKAPPKPKGERPEAAPTLPVDPPKPAAPKPRTEKVEVVALEAES